jgi:hypothetical protein
MGSDVCLVKPVGDLASPICRLQMSPCPAQSSAWAAEWQAAMGCPRIIAEFGTTLGLQEQHGWSADSNFISNTIARRAGVRIDGG